MYSCWNEPKKSELRTPELWDIQTSNTSNLLPKIIVELELQRPNFELLYRVRNYVLRHLKCHFFVSKQMWSVGMPFATFSTSIPCLDK